MSADEKRKFIIHSDGGSDLEAGHPYEQPPAETPPPARRRRCRKFKKFAFAFLFFFVLLHVLLPAARHHGCHMLRKTFGDGTVNKWLHHYSHHQHRLAHGHQGLARPYFPSRAYKNAFSHGISKSVNPHALSALAAGKLPITRVNSLFRNVDDVCIPSTPVADLEAFTFDPAEFPKIAHSVSGAIRSDVHVAVTSESQASYAVKVLVSDPSLAEKIAVSQNKDSSGQISFKLEGPKWTTKGEFNGDIDVGINVRKAEKSTIVAEAVNGEVSVRVAGGFDGSFTTGAFSGHVNVEDASDGTNRLHFTKNLKRAKAGTFGPEDSTETGDSTLRASVLNGTVSVEFE
ncbi:hypothetical protein GGI12_002407 [Dipsacomyces acuminosporus]|nr:hypothetical protein GGI12_002407 [Dipsacomyces acuminosporus]